MKDSVNRPYPGSSATARELILLAREYHRAAETLMAERRKGVPLSRAPARLCATHAIELYLNAALLHGGETAGAIRGHQHNLATLGAAAMKRGLVLKTRAADHLKRMTEMREYLVSRYGPEMTSSMTQINRLMATLNEVACKVGRIVPPDPGCSPDAQPTSARQAGSTVAKAC